MQWRHITGCGALTLDADSGGDRNTVALATQTRPIVVDIHCHFGVPAADAIVRAAYPDAQAGMDEFACEQTRAVNRAQFAIIGNTLNGVEQRLIDMDRSGIDVQALSPSPGQFYYHVDADTGRIAARATNQGIASAVAGHRDRFVGIATLPMQDIRLAIEEMTYCARELDFRGIEISTNINGLDLHDERFQPFLAAAEALDMLLFIHPFGFTQASRMTEYYFNNLIGNPLESTLAVGHLIFGGVLDRHPGLKICVAHGGGYIGSYWGRMDHAWRAREDCREHCKHQPSSYLRKIWFDTLVFDRQELESLVRTHGADRLCLGSDYPFDMAEPDPVGFLSGLDEISRIKILGTNAAGLLGLEETVPNPS